MTGRPPHPDQLTPAEWRTVDAVRHGLTNPAIARRLGVSVDAVKFHVGNALGKLGLSSRAELRRWAGVRRDSALAAASGTDEVTGLGQVARNASDVQATTRWFADMLGLPLLYGFPDLAFLDCGAGVRLMLAKGDPAANSILYFRVADIVAAHATLVERGAAVIAAPHRIHRHDDGTEEWMAFVADPDGAPVALMATAAPPSAGETP